MRGAPLEPDLVDAYLGAVDWLREILGRREVTEAWNRPSALFDYTIGGIAAHAVHGVVWLEQLLKDTEPVGLRAVGLGDFFGTNRVDADAEPDPFAASLRAAAVAFAATGVPVVVATCTAARDSLVELLNTSAAGRPVPVIRVPGGQVALSDYLQTRVLEVVVHGDDIVCSLPGAGLPEPPAPALEVSLGVCLRLARARVGDVASLRAFTRAERSLPEALRVL